MSIKEQEAIIEAMIQQARGDVGTSPERKGGKQPKGVNFAAILYEDCAEHMEMLKYLTTRQRYECVWIRHDKDVWSAVDPEVISGEHKDGESKKPHFHILWKVRTPVTAQSQQNFFSPWVKHVEFIRCCDSYIAYMIHDTPTCINKAQYDKSSLQGSQRLIKHAFGDEAIIQNKNLVEFAKTLTEGDGSVISLIGSLATIPDNEVSDYMYTLARFQGLLCEASRQERSRKIQKGN